MGSPIPERWDLSRIRKRLLFWYATAKRDLPWRQTTDPYAIWVSEIMLQQTRVAAVVDRYTSFLQRFPTFASLAAAPEQEVLAQWSGLGYYRRARMMQKAAQHVVEDLHGKLPPTASDLRKLPGIGSYTAAAIASIAHSEPIAVVDGNVERVLCRLSGWEATGPKGAKELRSKVDALANELLDPRRPGDFNQALMELGATVCLPRNPQCMLCPLAAECRTRGEHKTASRPRMLSREVGHALCLRLSPSAPEVLLEQRPATMTVMPGLWELPVLRELEVPPEKLRMTARHAIMNVNYYVRIRAVHENELGSVTVPGGERRWVFVDELSGMALTGLARKVLMRTKLLMPATDALRKTAVAAR